MSTSSTHSDVRLTSTVLPDDSASQGGQSVNVGSQFSALNPLNFDVSKCVFTAEDYLRIFQACGKDEAVKFRQLMEQQVQLMGRCVSMQFGAVRSASSGVCASSSLRSYERKSATSSGTRVTGIMGMRSWRKKIPDGLCYSKTLKSNVVQSQVNVLGEWPLVGSLLRLPASHYQSLDELERFRVVGDSERLHVKAGGNDGHSFLASMAKLATTLRCPVGTFGAVLKADGRSFGSAAPITGRTLVGGGGQSARVKDALEAYAGELFSGHGVLAAFEVVSATSGMHDAADKEALRMYEAVGDAALTLVLAARCQSVGCTVQQYQAARAACTNNSSLSSVFHSKFDTSMFAAPSGVSFSTGRVGASALEALLGLVYLHKGVKVVDKVCEEIGVFELANPGVVFPRQWAR